MRLFSESIGEGEPTLVLLHGLGGNGLVWRPLIEKLEAPWPGRILVPDLRGHGRSPRGAHYGIGQHAADVAELLPPDARVWLVGHSMGGLVGLALASGHFGVSAHWTFGFGIKVTWRDDELARLADLAKATPKVYPTREEAAERFLKGAGLVGLMAPDDEAVAVSLRHTSAGWSLTQDPATLRVAGPAFKPVLQAAEGAICLGRGEEDRMVSHNDLVAFRSDIVEFPGLGHNPHVEAPEAVAEVILQHLRSEH